jgi:aminocarboxymuconate-semialdehyde decarboxylase
VRLYGSDHVLLGTDYPFDMGDEDPVGFIAGATRLTGADRAAIMGLNAAKLLKIKVPKTKKPAVKKAVAKKPAKTARR